MAFIFDLSCYTVCFCIILTITRNTWLAVSFLPCSLSPSLSPSRSVVHLSPLSCCTCWIQCAHVWCTEMDWHCMCRHGHLHPWAAWVGRCLCLSSSTISFVFFFNLLTVVEYACVLVGGRADHTLQWSVNLSPEVVSPYPRKHSPCWHAGFPLV